MPNLPKPRLRRPGRRAEVLGPPAPPEPQSPNVEQIDSSGLRWVNIERPGSLERTWLEEHFDFHALDLEDVLSRNQRPKIDVYDDYLFIVLHLPVFDRAAVEAPGVKASVERRAGERLLRARLRGSRGWSRTLCPRR